MADISELANKIGESRKAKLNTPKNNQPQTGVRKNGANSGAQGFNPNNNKYRQNSGQTSQDAAGENLENAMQRQKVQNKKQMAKKALTTAAKAYNPAVGKAVEVALNTKKGDKLAEEYAKGETPTQGIKNVKKELDKDRKKMKLAIYLSSLCSGLLLLGLFAIIFAKNTDTMTYSKDNYGGIDQEKTENYDPINTNIFNKYPGLYQKVEKNVKKVSDKYNLQIDRMLVLATLIAPIENGTIVPKYDGTCGDDENGCYYLQGKSYKWEDFLELWGDQSYFLSKAMIMSYITDDSSTNVSCGSEQTMEQYAKNDLEVNEFNFWKLFNPVNWFKGFRDAADAELNAKCTHTPWKDSESEVPDVYVLSSAQGIYYNSIDENHNRTYEKDPNTGGVYFWNLVNYKGFIDVYFRDYLTIDENNTDEKNYENNLYTILEIANYIYAYYDDISLSCDKYDVIYNKMENIKVTDPGSSDYYEVPFEEQYIGGVLLAEYSSGPDEALKAHAILARTEAIAVVGIDGEGTIENSSNNQNYNKNYSPEKYPRIAKAVEATHGIVVSNYDKHKIIHTEYDAFCPTRREVDSRGYYYLDDTQEYLPINVDAYQEKTGSTFINPDSRYLKCPCFQNPSDRPGDLEDNKSIKYSIEIPTEPDGNPKQPTLEECWTDSGKTKDGMIGWKYKPTGGHGRGASQYGLTYFGAFDYDMEALLRLFYPKMVLRRLYSSLNGNVCTNKPVYDENDCILGSGVCNNELSYYNGQGDDDTQSDYHGEDYEQTSGDKGDRTYKTVTIGGRTYKCWRQTELPDIAFGGSNLAETGCSVVAATTAISGFTDVSIRDTAKNCYGRSFSGIKQTLDDYGVSYDGPYFLNSNDRNDAQIERMKKLIRDHFAKGMPVIALITGDNAGKHKYCTNNHFITLLGEDTNGNLILSNAGVEKGDLDELLRYYMPGGRMGVLLVGETMKNSEIYI